MANKHVHLKLARGLYDQIQEFMNAHPELGYRSVTAFIEERLRLLVLDGLDGLDAGTLSATSDVDSGDITTVVECVACRSTRYLLRKEGDRFYHVCAKCGGFTFRARKPRPSRTGDGNEGK